MHASSPLCEAFPATYRSDNMTQAEQSLSSYAYPFDFVVKTHLEELFLS